eukprot:1195318-Prorocentrum_minimum.AAC.1
MQRFQRTDLLLDDVVALPLPGLGQHVGLQLCELPHGDTPRLLLLLLLLLGLRLRLGLRLGLRGLGLAG